ncbi:hypothetical protein CHCC15325_4573 [Bacillus licheniformis]|nr:hypothetical protein B4090_0714 [Bacillus licheniformis]KYC79397.1 hypothetical protein B4091_0794 [Bacillus licheniformis]TWJ34699.1 hypothetical protein CHCC5025_2454 [Bacillus licheniformis]TWJ69310.1 hypothetical protein CHCC5020_0130 [Bacillus licheniformis]TWK21717.1 hypothetical protein CHCC20373_4546 [Bacillus licheniformis]
MKKGVMVLMSIMMKAFTNDIQSKNILNISTCRFTEFFMYNEIKGAKWGEDRGFVDLEG